MNFSPVGISSCFIYCIHFESKTNFYLNFAETNIFLQVKITFFSEEGHNAQLFIWSNDFVKSDLKVILTYIGPLDHPKES